MHKPVAGRVARWSGLGLLSVLLWNVLPAAPAFAHRLNVVALVQGEKVTGEAYFVDGSPAQNAVVTALDPAGKELARTTTDAQGRFSFPLRVRCDHRVVVDAGDGHGKTVTVPAKEMPGTLPAWDGEPASSGQEAASPASAQGPVEASSGQLAAIQEQLAGLRKELARHESKVRFHDVLAGLGFILGLMGLAFYFLGVRRRERLEGRRSNAEGQISNE